jgi:hypothetical protein
VSRRSSPQMHFSWKRWWLPLAAMLTALAMSLAVAVPAYAAVPGESNYWSGEQANGIIAANGTISQARNGGHLMDVWRGATNNTVWMAINNGAPFTLGSTTTYNSPTVVAYGSGYFMILHVGTNNNIYYTFIDPANRNWSGTWYSIPGQSTNMPVSATQDGAGQNNIELAYHSSNSDVVWSAFYDGNGSGWGGAVNTHRHRRPSPVRDIHRVWDPLRRLADGRYRLADLLLDLPHDSRRRRVCTLDRRERLRLLQAGIHGLARAEAANASVPLLRAPAGGARSRHLLEGAGGRGVQRQRIPGRAHQHGEPAHRGSLGNGNFAVFNVGTDHNVYWTFTQNGDPGNPASWNPWTQLTPIGGVQTDLPMAVTQLGENSNHLYMVWRGNGSDTQVYGSYFNGGGWGPVETLQGATNFQPSIIFDAFSEAIWVSVRGVVGGGVWLNSQNLGSPNWNGGFEVGGGQNTATGLRFRRLRRCKSGAKAKQRSVSPPDFDLPGLSYCPGIAHSAHDQFPLPNRRVYPTCPPGHPASHRTRSGRGIHGVGKATPAKLAHRSSSAS